LKCTIIKSKTKIFVYIIFLNKSTAKTTNFTFKTSAKNAEAERPDTATATTPIYVRSTQANVCAQFTYAQREGNAIWRLACCVCIGELAPLCVGFGVRTGEHRKTKFWRENFDISFGGAIRKQVAKA